MKSLGMDTKTLLPPHFRVSHLSAPCKMRDPENKVKSRLEKVAKGNSEMACYNKSAFVRLNILFHLQKNTCITCSRFS